MYVYALSIRNVVRRCIKPSVKFYVPFCFVISNAHRIGQERYHDSPYTKHTLVGVNNTFTYIVCLCFL